MLARPAGAHAHAHTHARPVHSANAAPLESARLCQTQSREYVGGWAKTSRRLADRAATVCRICIIAGDISPIDVITHVPVMCEDADVPYCYVPSKQVQHRACVGSPLCRVLKLRTFGPVRVLTRAVRDGVCRPRVDLTSTFVCARARTRLSIRAA